jgi:hypothetical protein
MRYFNVKEMAKECGCTETLMSYMIKLGVAVPAIKKRRGHLFSEEQIPALRKKVQEVNQ